MSKLSLQTFTTRLDTIYAVTFLVMAPEHALVREITKPDYREAVEKYVEQTKQKSELERQQNKEKTGVFTGSFVRHPLTGAKIPVWVSDFVLPNYGTGCVMADAHDIRDLEMALKYQIPLKENISQDGQPRTIEDLNQDNIFVKDGVLFDSEEFSGLDSKSAREKIAEKLIKMGKGKKQINYKFRDWVFSRQRYWGEPFPLEYVRV